MSLSSASQGMHNRIVRFKDLKKQGIPLMFIDSILPGHQRMNYTVIGDTASENPDFSPNISDPHKFQIGMFCAMPDSGPAYHTHDYTEMFLILSGSWRFYWGEDPEADPEDEAILERWDMITLPPKLWRGFEVAYSIRIPDLPEKIPTGLLMSYHRRLNTVSAPMRTGK
jgi:mannose-6-phosphate isomerase-like protein (cupin superfamily)